MADPTDVMNEIVSESQKQGLDPRVALAVAHQESGFDQNAKSGAGALGVMQLMPDTAKTLGVDPTDVHQNIRGGVKYLKQLHDKYGDTPSALWAYHAGPGSVEAQHMPDVTRSYIDRVMGDIGGGEAPASAAPLTQPAGSIPGLGGLTPAPAGARPVAPGQLPTRGQTRTEQFLNAAGFPSASQSVDIAHGDVSNLQDIYQSLKDGRYKHAMIAAGQYAASPIIGMGNASNDHMARMRDDWGNGNYGGAITHVLAAALPFFPPLGAAAEVSDELAKPHPDYATAATKMGGAGVGAALGLGGVSKADAMLGNPGQNIINATRNRVRGVMGREPLPEQIATQTQQQLQSHAAAALAQDANTSAAAKAINEVYKPENGADFMEDTKNYRLPLLKNIKDAAGGQPLTRGNLSSLLDVGLQDIFAQTERYIRNSVESGHEFQGDPIADAQIAGIPKLIKNNSELYKRYVDSINSQWRGKTYSAQDLFQFHRENNAIMRGFHGVDAAEQSAIVNSNVAKAIQDAGDDQIMSMLYKGVDPNKLDPRSAGANIAELQRRYGALAKMRDQDKTFVDNLANSPYQPPMDLKTALKESIAEGVPVTAMLLGGGAGVGHMGMGGLGEVAGVTAALGDIGARTWMKMKNAPVSDSAKLINAINSYKGPGLSRVPEPSRLPDYRPINPNQLPPGTVDLTKLPR